MQGTRRRGQAVCKSIRRATSPTIGKRFIAWPNKLHARSDVDADGRATAAGSNTAPYLPYHDLRQWLEEAKKLGEVKEVGGLSYQRDIGMVAEMSAHADDAPCFVFEDVPGTLPGSRLLVNFFAGKRKNMTLGFSTELSKLELSESFRVNHAGDGQAHSAANSSSPAR